jgi:hypothetical protein
LTAFRAQAPRHLLHIDDLFDPSRGCFCFGLVIARSEATKQSSAAAQI